MYIQFQSQIPGNACTAYNFEDQKAFLNSLASGSEFKIYEGTGTRVGMSIKKVLKKLIIKSVKPINQPGKSFYLSFTALNAENESETYEGMICW